MDNNEKLREIVRELVQEFFEQPEIEPTKAERLKEATLEEERITNTEARNKVQDRENFVGSHTFGEDIGDLGKMYVAFSYGKDHPLYMYKDGSWYQNNEDYVNDDGSVNVWTKKHLIDLKPGKVTSVTKEWMKKELNKFMKSNNIKDLSHSDVDPGEK